MARGNTVPYCRDAEIYRYFSASRTVLLRKEALYRRDADIPADSSALRNVFFGRNLRIYGEIPPRNFLFFQRSFSLILVAWQIVVSTESVWDTLGATSALTPPKNNEGRERLYPFSISRTSIPAHGDLPKRLDGVLLSQSLFIHVSIYDFLSSLIVLFPQ